MGQFDVEEKVKGQNLARMNLIVKRIESELDQLKNLINLQIDGLTSTTNTNCDENENCDTSIPIDNNSHCPLVETAVKIEDDQISIKYEDPDYDYVVNNYNYKVQELNEDQVNNSRNRLSNENELALGGLNFNLEVSSKEVEATDHDVDPQSSSFKPNSENIGTVETCEQDKLIVVEDVVNFKTNVVDSIQIPNENLEGLLERAGKNDKESSQKLIVQMGLSCVKNPLILHSNRREEIDGKTEKSQSKSKINQQNGKKVISSKPKESRKKIHNCSLCSKSFPNFSALSIHLRVHTGERPFKCKICSKSFKDTGHLKRHNLVHTGEKLFSCSVCEKSFARHDQLNRHMLVHKDKKPQVARKLSPPRPSKTENAQKESKIVDFLSKSEKSGKKPKICSICSKSINSKLSRHMMVHTGERPFKCKICSKSFNREGHLKSHNLVHTGEKPFSCTVCSKTFAHSSSLSLHMKKHHPLLGSKI